MELIRRIFRHPFFASAYPKNTLRYRLYYLFNSERADNILREHTETMVDAAGGIEAGGIEEATLSAGNLEMRN